MKRILLLAVALAALPLQIFSAGIIVIHEGPGWLPPRPPHPPIIVPPPHIPPRPWPPPHPVFAPLEVTYHKISARITDQVAVTSIDQEFYNPNAQQLEGTFLFPVPKGAQLDKFTMEIGGKPVSAELLAADKARKIYEDIVRSMKDPALLEYSGRDLFKCRVFPIEPHARKRITLSYTQLLKGDSGVFTYTYPLNTEKFSARPIKTVGLKIEIDAQRPLKTLYSPTHNVEIRRDGERRATIGYEATEVRADRDFQVLFSHGADDVDARLLTHRTAAGDGFFVLLASPGVNVKEEKIVKKDIAFVLDTSGSMAGAKLEQAKKALAFCIENLNDTDRFEVIRFSTDTEPVFQKLTDATPAARKRAHDFVRNLKPTGGTAIDDALKFALGLRPDRGDRPFVVIFLTDGLPTVGVVDADSILSNATRAAAGSTRVFCFGIGHDVNTHLLDKLSDATRAFSTYVLPEEDIEVKVSNFYAKIKEPVLASPKLAFPDAVRATKMYPSPLPDIFKGEQLVLVGRYAGDGSGKIVLEGTVNGETRKFHYDAKFPADNSGNDFIPRLWATRRIGYLLDEIRLRGESKELKDEVTDLARQFGVVTPYTAYLILEDEDRRHVPRSAQSLPTLQSSERERRSLATAYDTLKRDKDGAAAVANARAGFQLKAAQNASEAITQNNFEAARALTYSPGGRAGAAAPLFSAPMLNAPAAASTAPSPRFSVATPSGPAGATAAPVAKRPQAESLSQFVNGKNFFQNENQWIDSDAQKLTNAKRLRVQFNSTEYFDLARRHPEALPWLALGTRVQFNLADTIYEIYE
jgi:Ca-activated chloride channel family protein